MCVLVKTSSMQVCLEHVEHLKCTKCGPEDRTLRMRYTADELESLAEVRQLQRSLFIRPFTCYAQRAYALAMRPAEWDKAVREALSHAPANCVLLRRLQRKVWTRAACVVPD